MKLLIYVGGFHEEIPFAEAGSLGFKIEEKNGRILLGTTKDPERLKRLGYTHLLLGWLGEFGFEEDLPFDVDSAMEGSVAVRFKKHNFEGDFLQTKREILEKLNPFLDKVDLEDPDTVLYFFLGKDKVYVGKLFHKFDPSQFQQRRNDVRPFNRPISLPQRESRSWINLTGVQKNDKFLDPFCGTGGILIEGDVLGCEVHGSDADLEMIEGCRLNLDYFGLDANLKRCAVRNLSECWEKKFDGIVTDPPYGIASKVGGERIEDLYRNSLLEFEKVLKKEKRCVLGAPERLNFESILQNSATRFQLMNKFREEVHDSLTREIFVLKK